MTLWTVAQRWRNLLPGLVEISQHAVIKHADNAFAKAKRHIERRFKNLLHIMINKRPIVSFFDPRQAFTEVFGMSELHGNGELAGSVDIAPLARIRNQAKIRYSLLADID